MTSCAFIGLINAITDKVHFQLGPILVTGSVYSRTIVGTSLNIVAITDSKITSVKFKWSSNSRTESGKPFAMGGDKNEDFFDTPYLSSPGDKIIVLEQYEHSNLVLSTTYKFKLIA